MSLWLFFGATYGGIGKEDRMSEVKIGERMKIPVHSVFHQESGHVGKVVFISEDKNTVTVKCDRKHGGKTVAFNIALQPRDY